jgi:hypothetical protein
MNNKNKIVILGYQLATILIQWILFNFLLAMKKEKNNGNNYNKVISLDSLLLILV